MNTNTLRPPSHADQLRLDVASLDTQQVHEICHAFARGALDERQGNTPEAYASVALEAAYNYGRAQAKSALAALAERQSKGPR